MNLDPNRSAWLAEAGDYQPLPSLRGEARADLAVIGGGLTGVSTAWQVSHRFPNRRIVLLEAASLANGATGRNGGQVLTGLNGIHPSTPEEEKRIYEITRQGVDLVEEYATRFAPQAGFQREGSLSVYTDPRRAEAAKAQAEQARAIGIPLEWREGRSLGIQGCSGGVWDPHAGRVNGAALVRGMRAALQAQGVEIWEGTPVVRVDEGREIRLATPHGSVRAAAIVLATNAYSAALGYFRDRILPLQSHVIATSPLPPDAWAAMGWVGFDAFSDDLDRVAYGCRTRDGRLVFGGGSNLSYDYHYGGALTYRASAERASRSFAAVRDSMVDYLPRLREVPVVHQWSGVIDLSFDRSASIGVMGEHGNIYYGIGYSGHGVALSALAGRVICDLYSDHHEPWREAPFYQRQLPWIPPDPPRWLGYQMYTRLTGRTPRRG